MPAVEKRTVSLPKEHAAFADELVDRGAYASVSEVVRAGLRALKERDEAVERWLREDVAPAYDAIKADPDRGEPASEVFDQIRSKHAARLSDAK